MLTARGNDGDSQEWRGSSTALLGWAFAVEVGRGGQCVGGLVVASVVVLVLAHVAASTPARELAGDTAMCLVIVALYAAAPLFWIVSRPARDDEDANAKVGT